MLRETMKDIAKLSKRELRGEVMRHRQTLQTIAASKSGCLASTYVEIAVQAMQHEERLHCQVAGNTEHG